MKNYTVLPASSQIKVTPAAHVNKSTTGNLGVALGSSFSDILTLVDYSQSVSNIQPHLKTDTLVGLLSPLTSVMPWPPGCSQS